MHVACHVSLASICGALWTHQDRTRQRKFERQVRAETRLGTPPSARTRASQPRQSMLVLYCWWVGLSSVTPPPATCHVTQLGQASPPGHPSSRGRRRGPTRKMMAVDRRGLRIKPSTEHRRAPSSRAPFSTPRGTGPLRALGRAQVAGFVPPTCVLVPSLLGVAMSWRQAS